MPKALVFILDTVVCYIKFKVVKFVSSGLTVLHHKTLQGHVEFLCPLYVLFLSPPYKQMSYTEIDLELCALNMCNRVLTRCLYLKFF